MKSKNNSKTSQVGQSRSAPFKVPLIIVLVMILACVGMSWGFNRAEANEAKTTQSEATPSQPKKQQYPICLPARKGDMNARWRRIAGVDHGAVAKGMVHYLLEDEEQHEFAEITCAGSDTISTKTDEKPGTLFLTRLSSLPEVMDIEKFEHENRCTIERIKVGMEVPISKEHSATKRNFKKDKNFLSSPEWAALMRKIPTSAKWYKYQPNELFPYGIDIETCEGYITAYQRSKEDTKDYDILGSTYVVDDLDTTDITRDLCRAIDLKIIEADGGTTELTITRPLWWIEKTNAKIGNAIDLGMLEYGILENAKVMAINPIYRDSRDCDDGYQLVTGTIKHDNAECLELTFDNSDIPLGVTAPHPLYSFTRNAWVAAGELRISEKIQAREKVCSITGRKTTRKLQTVYNLEVHRAHNFFVGNESILAHNSDILHCQKILASQEARGMSKLDDLVYASKPSTRQMHYYENPGHHDITT